MKAVLFKSIGAPLSVETMPDPVAGTGEVVVDIVAAPVLAYAGEVFSGVRAFLMTLPMVPGVGGVGRVRTIGPDATQLQIGDWVICDPTVRSRDNASAPEIILQGLTAASPAGLGMQHYFRHGAWAQQIRIPTENAIRLGAIDSADAARWCKMGAFLVPYGGLLAARLQAGEVVLINGATGSFGSAGVAVAMAMGAARVVATGRSAAALADLERRFGPRVKIVQMSGDEDADRRAMQTAAGQPIDCVLDILPPAASATWVRAAIMAVRPNGRAVLMGGIQTGLELPYPWLMRNNITLLGQWMYPPNAPAKMVALIRAGMISLDHFTIAEFDLDEVQAAVTHAAAHAGPFEVTVLKP